MDLSYNSNRSLQCIESVTDDQLCSNIVFNYLIYIHIKYSNISRTSARSHFE